jgi:hypothetical protein
MVAAEMVEVPGDPQPGAMGIRPSSHRTAPRQTHISPRIGEPTEIGPGSGDPPGPDSGQSGPDRGVARTAADRQRATVFDRRLQVAMPAGFRATGPWPSAAPARSDLPGIARSRATLMHA